MEKKIYYPTFDDNKFNIDKLILWYPDLGKVLIFAHDISGGHAHYMLDYNEDNMNPKVIYFDNEIGNKNVKANSFKEFIDGLEIEEVFA